MKTVQLNHFALLTDNMSATIEFYTRYIGLELGEPLEGGFGQFLYFPGTDQAVVHMLDIETAKKIDNSKPKGFQLYASLENSTEKRKTTGAIDHVAFLTNKAGFDELPEKLNTDNIPYRLGDELAPSNLQVWMTDPNGIKVEVGCFPLKEGCEIVKV
ncbi:MAG: VOC family protein [Legionellales bacterium]|nr:VOC family protein [Legionellales bacterium]